MKASSTHGPAGLHFCSLLRSAQGGGLATSHVSLHPSLLPPHSPFLSKVQINHVLESETLGLKLRIFNRDWFKNKSFKFHKQAIEQGKETIRVECGFHESNQDQSFTDKFFPRAGWVKYHYVLYFKLFLYWTNFYWEPVVGPYSLECLGYISEQKRQRFLAWKILTLGQWRQTINNGHNKI